MESDMVKNESENNELVKGFFYENFPDFSLVDETSHGPYWGVKFNLNEIDVKIEGDIAFSIHVVIDGTKYDLWRYNKIVNNHLKTSKENILFQLSILKKFLS